MPPPTEERSEEADSPSQGASEEPLRYATPYHIPVLCKIAISGVVTDPQGLYIDATLGGGGHSAALLDALAPEGRVLGIDRDVDALAATRQRLAAEIDAGRFRALHGSFGDLTRLLQSVDVTEIDGLLVDLGVSSHQLDVPERGFSYAATGALDMRMDTQGGLSADDIVNRWREEELRQILYTYGEEKRGRKIAWAIVQARPIPTTTALAEVVRRVVPTREEVKTLARVFQAIRLAVNGELEQLEKVLAAGVRLLKPGRRMAVLSYHSLEDRRVKRFFRYGNLRGEPERDLYGHSLSPWREITRKPIQADAEEVAANPRSRSVRLRIAERRP